MKKLLSVFALVLILVGCSDLLEEPSSLVDGFGTVNINIGGEKSARTLLPGKVYGSYYYVLTFTPDGGGDGLAISVDEEDEANVKLLPGDWTVDVKGFLSEEDAGDETKAVITGDKDFSVAANEEITVMVDVTPSADRLTQNGNGKLGFSIMIPAGASGNLKVLTLTGM